MTRRRRELGPAGVIVVGVLLGCSTVITAGIFSGLGVPHVG